MPLSLIQPRESGPKAESLLFEGGLPMVGDLLGDK